MSLAQTFPDVNFVAAGASHDSEYDSLIRGKYSNLDNLELPGFVDGRDKDNLLDSAWILINTSISECLPVSFLEAAAHGCAILSPHNPDGFASRLGYHLSVDEMLDGISRLLHNELWKRKGKKGYRYVKKVQEKERVIDVHLEEYARWI